jgi:hypothetical protein
MTAGERLRQLAGFSGSAAALLLSLGTGATAGELLRSHSGLVTGTASEHILVEVNVPVVVPENKPPLLTGGRGGAVSVNLNNTRDYIKPRVIPESNSIITDQELEEEELLSLLVQFVGNCLCRI